jgi:hypothetical protein
MMTMLAAGIAQLFLLLFIFAIRGGDSPAEAQP